MELRETERDLQKERKQRESKEEWVGGHIIKLMVEISAHYQKHRYPNFPYD